MRSVLHRVPFIAALVALPASGRADDLAVALDRSVSLERLGQFTEAAETLEAARPEAAEYAVELRLGWLWFQAGDYARARTHYTAAATISRGGSEPRLGLAWCALREGRSDDARAGFSSLLDESPELLSAREGLALAEAVPAVVATVGVSAIGHAYGGSPSKSWGVGSGVDLGLEWRNGAVLGASYQFTEFGTRGTPMAPGSSFDHHAMFVNTGYQSPTYGFTVHYGLLADRSSAASLSHVMGARLELRLLGELSLEASVTLPEGSAPVVRVAPAWRVDVGGGFALTPAVGLQRAEDDVLWNVGLTAEWNAARGGAWVSGKYGDEVRPAYLDLALAYDTSEVLRYGASAGGWVRLAQSWALTFAYEWVRYGLDVGSDEIESNAHFFKVGGLWTSEAAP